MLCFSFASACAWGNPLQRVYACAAHRSKASRLQQSRHFEGPLPRLASAVQNRCLLRRGEEFGGGQVRLVWDRNGAWAGGRGGNLLPRPKACFAVATAGQWERLPPHTFRG